MSQTSFIYDCETLRFTMDPDNQNELALHIGTKDGGTTIIHLFGLSELGIALAFGALPPMVGDPEPAHA